MEQVSQAAAATTGDSSVNLYAFVFVLAVMLVGAAVHWVKLRKSGRTESSLLDYILTDNPKASAKAGGSILVTAAVAAGTDVANLMDPIVLWSIVSETHTMPSICFFCIGGAFAFGYMADSGVNATAPANAAPTEESKP